MLHLAGRRTPGVMEIMEIYITEREQLLLETFFAQKQLNSIWEQLSLCHHLRQTENKSKEHIAFLW